MKKAVYLWAALYIFAGIITYTHIQSIKIDQLTNDLRKQRMASAWHAGINHGLVEYCKNYPVLVIDPTKPRK